MSVQDITPDAVLAAVLDGHDDAASLAEHFGVLPRSHTLTQVLRELVEADRLVYADPRQAEGVRRWAVA